MIDRRLPLEYQHETDYRKIPVEYLKIFLYILYKINSKMISTYNRLKLLLNYTKK